MSPGGSKIDSQRPLGSCWRLFGVQVEFGTNFGAIWRPNLGPCWGQFGTKSSPKSEHTSDTSGEAKFQPCWIGCRHILAPFLKRCSHRSYTSLRRCGNSKNRSFASARIKFSRFRRCQKASKKASKSSLGSNFGSKRPWEACKARFLDDLGVVLGPTVAPNRGPKHSWNFDVF